MALFHKTKGHQNTDCWMQKLICSPSILISSYSCWGKRTDEVFSESHIQWYSCSSTLPSFLSLFFYFSSTSSCLWTSYECWPLKFERPTQGDTTQGNSTGLYWLNLWWSSSSLCVQGRKLFPVQLSNLDECQYIDLCMLILQFTLI